MLSLFFQLIIKYQIIKNCFYLFLIYRHVYIEWFLYDDILGDVVTLGDSGDEQKGKNEVTK